MCRNICRNMCIAYTEWIEGFQGRVIVAVSVIIFSLYRGFNNIVRGFIKLYKNQYILETIFCNFVHPQNLLEVMWVASNMFGPIGWVFWGLLQIQTDRQTSNVDTYRRCAEICVVLIPSHENGLFGIKFNGKVYLNL